ncbi:MAG: aminotransferase class III-fold pyridoxal phosphate-dependent enzyme, partial [Candidatus Omnitrophica bacterium]|nr:aminotransferase class III-fold pyridoxal phosphate-dependent enzyme [Candidatus Omnitrophota bacterium]
MTQEVIKQYDRYVMNTYVRSPLVLTKGKGSRVWDVEGREYLDLFPGWGVSGLGYNHPWVMSALRGQSRRLTPRPERPGVMTGPSRHCDCEQLEQELNGSGYHGLLQKLQQKHLFLGCFRGWTQVIAFMRNGTSSDP